MDICENYGYYYLGLVGMLFFIATSEYFIKVFLFILPIFYIFTLDLARFWTRTDYIIPLFKIVFSYLMLLSNHFYGIKVCKDDYSERKGMFFRRKPLTEKESEEKFFAKFKLNENYFAIIVVILIFITNIEYFWSSMIVPLIVLGSVICQCAIRYLISPLLVIQEKYHGGKLKEATMQQVGDIALEKDKFIIRRRKGAYVTFENDPNRYIVRGENMQLFLSENTNKTFYYVTKTDIFGEVFLSKYPQEEEFTPSELKSQENLFYSLIPKRFNNVISNIIGSVVILTIMVILFVI